MRKQHTYNVIIPCAGSGKRFLTAVPKQYMLFGKSTVLEYTIRAFLAVEELKQIMLVVAQGDTYAENYALLSPKIKIAYVGGETRAHSVFNGLKSLSCSNHDWVLVHDAVRCLIKPSLIKRIIAELSDDSVGGILALPVNDSLKMVDKNNVIVRSMARDNMYAAQTPQMFRYSVLYQALEQSYQCLDVTDEASSVERLNLPVKIVLGDICNIKVTYPADLILAGAILANG